LATKKTSRTEAGHTKEAVQSAAVAPPVEQEPTILFTDKYTYNRETDTYITFLDRCKVRIQLSGEQHRAMKDAYSNWTGKPETINEICRTFGMRRDYLMEYKSAHGWTHDSEPVTTEDLLTRNEDDMVEDFIQKKKLSLFKKFEKRKWQTTQQDHEKWQNFEQNVLIPLQQDVRKNLPNYKPPILKLKKADEPFAVVLSPFDLHYGKQGWMDESGQTYNREQARSLLIEHTENLANMVAKFGAPEKFIVATGSDWFHIDTLDGTTTRGTPQDCDGTYAQIFIEGTKLAQDHIELLAQIAPVEVLNVPGNHDRSSSLGMISTLNAYFHKHERVNVVLNPKRRQYTMYGDSILGFSHGDAVKPGDALAVMVKEARDLYAQSNYGYFFTGHLHHEVIREIHGITHIQLKSLSGVDRFHSNNGYITSGRALQAFVVSQDKGIIAQLVSPVKNDQLFGVKIKKQKTKRK
jgi:UDP-2,3-diacylglucosamine pyrophosphatase LpxH